MITFEQTYTLIVYYLGIVAWIWLALIFLKRYLQSRKIFGEEITAQTLFILLIAVFAEALATTYYGVSWSNEWWWKISWLDVLRSPILWGIPRTAILVGAILMLYLAVVKKVKAPLYSAFRPIGLSLKVFQGLRDGLEKMYEPKATSLMLYRAGKEAGMSFAEEVTQETGAKGRALFDQIVERNQNYRWAEMIKVEDFQSGRRVTVAAKGSFESAGRKSPSPLCDFQRGFWAGVCQDLNPDMVCEAEEVSCEAKGDSQCKFQAKFFERAQPTQEAAGL